jgi:tRNA/rRNA methyltransferase
MTRINAEPSGATPSIILVAPQLGENIGTAARAMANFGLGDLRLVNPRDGWPNDKARAAASRADHVIDGVRIFTSVADAINDLSFVYATTARAREVAKPVAGPREAGRRLRTFADSGVRTGILFGPERTGLNNEDVSLVDEILTFPVDPAFSSINVAQSVLLVAYEWRLSGLAEGEAGLPFRVDRYPAPKDDLLRLFEHLETALDAAGFFRPPEKKPHMVEALRTLLHRAELSAQEVRTLRGVVAALEKRPTRPHAAAKGETTTARRGKA